MQNIFRLKSKSYFRKMITTMALTVCTLTVSIPVNAIELQPESGMIDTEGPVLQSLTMLSPVSLKGGDTVEFVAEATDDMSGVENISMTLTNDQGDTVEEGYKGSFRVSLEGSYYDESQQRKMRYADGKLRGKAQIPENAACGTYHITDIWIRDTVYNLTTYGDNVSYEFDEELPDSVKSISVEITESNRKENLVANCTVKDVILSDTEINVPGKLRVSVELEGDCSDITQILIKYGNNYEDSRAVPADAYLKKDDNGKYSGEFFFDEVSRAGIYRLYGIWYYQEHSDEEIEASNLSDAVKESKFEVLNEIGDTQPPVIEDIIPCVDQITVPGWIRLKVIGHDDISGVGDSLIYFSNTKGIGSASSRWCPEASSYIELYFDPYSSHSGTYKVSGLDLKDKYNNRFFTLMGKKEIPDNLKDISFEVINDADTADLVSSTLKDNLLEQIKETKNDAVINVDVSGQTILAKDILSFVKGTDRVLNLNSYNNQRYDESHLQYISGGIVQWMICGKDITGEPRDVDLYAERFQKSQNAKIQSVLEKTYAIYLKLGEDTDLPFKAKLRIVPNGRDISNLEEAEQLYLYRYDKTLEKLCLFATDVTLTKEYNLEFETSQGGEYVITTKKISDIENEDPSDSPSDDIVDDPADDSDDYAETIPTGPNTWENKQGTEGFVYRLYNVALTRDAEEKGLNDWNNQLTTKAKTAAEVGQGIFFSQEFQNHNYSNVQFVKMLYRTMFGREADEAGLKGWVSKLNSGMSREYVYHGFAESQEFQNLCDSYHINRGTVTLGQYRDKNEGATGYVARLYTKMLGRKYEDNGIEYWCKQYLTGKATIESIATNGFLHSQEFTNLNLSNEEFVTRMYQTFLNREPDEAGYKDWVGKLNSGEKTRDQLVYGFSLSQEFANLKKSYGL